MSISCRKREAEVLKLEAVDRAYVLEKLIESFEPDSTVQDGWLAEAIRRRDEVRSGKARLLPGDDVLAAIQARLA